MNHGFRGKLTAFIFLFAVVGSLMSASARAEQVDAAGIIQQIDLYDALLKYPQPSWISGPIESADLLARSEFFKEQIGPTFVFEQIPEGESFERWQSLYAVIAQDLAPDQKVPMLTFVELSVKANERACADGDFGVQVLTIDDADATVAMVCGATAHGAADIGYGPDVGEVSIWRFLIFANTYIKVYHRWRGAAFDIDTKDKARDWPVAESEFVEMVRRMGSQIEVSPNILKP